MTEISASMNHYYPSHNHNEQNSYHNGQANDELQSNKPAKIHKHLTPAEEYKKYMKAFCYWNLEQFQADCQKLKSSNEAASGG